MGKIFNKGLIEDDKKEGLLKRLKNIEDKNQEKLKAIKNKTENIKEVTDFVNESLSLQAKWLTEEIKIIQKDVDYRKLKITGSNNATYDFSDYKIFKELFRDLYYRNMSINGAERKQDKFDTTLGALSIYPAKNKKYLEAKNKLLNNAKNFYKDREKIIEGFKNKIFPLYYDEEEEEQELDTRKKKIRSEMKMVSLIIKGLRD